MKGRKANGQKADLLSGDGRIKIIYPKVKKESHSVYKLGAKHKDTYFTQREAECMVGLLEGKTESNIAIVLGLSSRTVESYVGQIRTKLGCKNKIELCEKVRASNFVKSIDFNL
jgi:DNA-binding CsgD family transcriptional regulator